MENSPTLASEYVCHPLERLLDWISPGGAIACLHGNDTTQIPRGLAPRSMSFKVNNLKFTLDKDWQSLLIYQAYEHCKYFFTRETG